MTLLDSELCALILTKLSERKISLCRAQAKNHTPRCLFEDEQFDLFQRKSGGVGNEMNTSTYASSAQNCSNATRVVPQPNKVKHSPWTSQMTPS